ncbi:MAG: hypothetical protein XU11_C0009G0026 [Candidatus Dadabacteria bacterium CSP1-2]|nr:MAG: hypothetical protein XU11_C0009G0026 [Candidatus Dadabacteria bacterium CSP1-2]
MRYKMQDAGCRMQDTGCRIKDTDKNLMHRASF